MATIMFADAAWTMLTGGVGNSKTWLLDLDANGISLKFGGPKWFYTSGMSWASFHNIAGENYLDSEQWDSSTAIDPRYASEWYWAADWAGNGWICGAADYGTMTFDLINGANVDVNAMQIMFDGGSNENTPFTFNYISKEYKDNYVAPIITTITLPENWDEDAPFTWFTLAGEEISRAGFDGDPDITDAEFELNSKTKTFKITDIAGNVTEGTYEISEDGVLTFSQLPSFGISTNKNIKFASSTNELQVITYEISDRTGDLTDLWLGSNQYDDQGNAYEYLAYHFKKQTGGAQVESFTGKLSYSDTGWAFLESPEVYITGEGDYTFTLTPNGSTNTQDPYLMFLDVAKILKKHPNTDMILKSIKVDGAEISATTYGTIQNLSSMAPSSYQVGSVYSTSADPTVGGTRQIGSIDENGKVTAVFSGLAEGTTYYYATFVTLQGKVTKYGDIKSFVATDADVATQAATDITACSATLNGQAQGISDILAATSVGFKRWMRLLVHSLSMLSRCCLVPHITMQHTPRWAMVLMTILLGISQELMMTPSTA